MATLSEQITDLDKQITDARKAGQDTTVLQAQRNTLAQQMAQSASHPTTAQIESQSPTNKPVGGLEFPAWLTSDERKRIGQSYLVDPSGVQANDMLEDYARVHNQSLQEQERARKALISSAITQQRTVAAANQAGVTTPPVVNTPSLPPATGGGIPISSQEGAQLLGNQPADLGPKTIDTGTGAQSKSLSQDTSGLPDSAVPKTPAAQRAEYFTRMAERLQAQRDQHASTMTFIPGIGMTGRAAEIYQMTPNIELQDKMEQANQLALQNKKEGYQTLDRIVNADQVMNNIIQNRGVSLNDIQKVRMIDDETIRQTLNMGTAQVENEIKRINAQLPYKNAMQMAAAQVGLSEMKLYAVMKTAIQSGGTFADFAMAARALGVDIDSPVNSWWGDLWSRVVAGRGADYWAQRQANVGAGMGGAQETGLGQTSLRYGTNQPAGGGTPK